MTAACSYYQAYQMIRGITGIGEGKGPFIAIHDGFDGPGAGHLAWAGYLAGADRIAVSVCIPLVACHSC